MSSAVRWLDRDSYTVAFAALSEPSGTQDFTFDWRSLVNETTRVLTPNAEMQMRDALADFRDAVKPSTEFPELTLDVDLPLPLAALAGSAWRPATRLVLTVASAPGRASSWSTATARRLCAFRHGPKRCSPAAGPPSSPCPRRRSR